ncbi:DUF6192 family protein [Crossiella cryophila]|uniref:Uncharacterized protein n=1 Tax=Crossiella cryophila TaxID=43355 RepID=A0A7W7CDN7_9PSEU|nr:DUF6192 family protein [Crossiella cryophila]MBB4679214.1 hypothetical protein [Crossiella cryophila]
MAARWPASQRRDGVSYAVHRILATVQVDRDRFAMIKRAGARTHRRAPLDH